MIVDWQHHIGSKAVYDRRGGTPGQPVYEKGKIVVHPRTEVYQVEKHLEFMQNAGIDGCVISSTLSSVEDCRLNNDFYAELTTRYPGTFACLSPCLPLQDGALAELDRAINGLGLRGVVISPQNDGKPLDARELWPFYEQVSGYGLPIFIHVSGVPKGLEAFDAPYDLNISMTREVDIALNTVRLVLGGTLTAFPDLTFVIAHLGGGIASIYDRIVRYIRVKGARYWTDYGGTPPFDEPYHENFARGFDRLYFDLAGFEGGMAALRSALTVIRPERLLFGTDYPYNFDLDGAAVRKYIENVRGLDCSPRQVADILGGTATRLVRF